jgi:nucleoid-associated protein YgaU
MRKDVKVVVAAACLLLVGLLSYVLFAPSHKKAEVADESTTSTTSSTSTEGAGGTTTGTATTPQASTEAPQQPADQTPPPPVNVALTPPAQQPTVSVSIGQPDTTQPAVTAPTAVVPSVDSNVAVGGATPTASTDWDKTLNSGAVATATGTHAGFPGGTSNGSALMGTTDTAAGSSYSSPAAATPASPSFAAAPSATQDRSASSSTGPAKTHKVVYGETLSSIAAEYYGNRGSYTKIAAANPGIDPNRLKVGTVLKIPDLKDSSRSAEGSSASAAEKAAPGTTYTVKPGDSLQKISSKLYGSSDKWQKIYELNRSSIGSNPQLLKAGAVLKLPESTASAR